MRLEFWKERQTDQFVIACLGECIIRNEILKVWVNRSMFYLRPLLWSVVNARTLKRTSASASGNRYNWALYIRWMDGLFNVHKMYIMCTMCFYFHLFQGEADSRACRKVCSPVCFGFGQNQMSVEQTGGNIQFILSCLLYMLLYLLFLTVGF